MLGFFSKIFSIDVNFGDFISQKRPKMKENDNEAPKRPKKCRLRRVKGASPSADTTTLSLDQNGCLYP